MKMEGKTDRRGPHFRFILIVFAVLPLRLHIHQNQHSYQLNGIMGHGLVINTTEIGKQKEQRT
ncbi:hypothetical protein BBP18_09315 [Bacillus velezensis]|nr:hypothetical protein AAV29_08710 [Bacillus velezensis]KTF62059.1 hypothetical protein AR691_00405 [Bacillus amyloliquefaciens]MBR8691872.1 hypothetical protein [Bacillus velezensis]OPD46843.1 hypothetical protein BVF98_04540 [Bacillus amyloliquefaciens]OQV41498.1 hypothetical protein B5M57_11885 [Bacillus velezensis]